MQKNLKVGNVSKCWNLELFSDTCSLQLMQRHTSRQGAGPHELVRRLQAAKACKLRLGTRQSESCTKDLACIPCEVPASMGVLAGNKFRPRPACSMDRSKWLELRRTSCCLQVWDVGPQASIHDCKTKILFVSALHADRQKYLLAYVCHRCPSSTTEDHVQDRVPASHARKLKAAPGHKPSTNPSQNMKHWFKCLAGKAAKKKITTCRKREIAGCSSLQLKMQ